MDINNCPFCANSIDDAVFAESPHFKAIYNIAPILPGHSLVVPKKHVESLMDLNERELCEFMVFGRKVAKILLSAFSTDAFNWTIQEKEAAGQTVPHLHMHVIPRNPDDLPHPGDWYPKLKTIQPAVVDSSERSRLSDSEMRETVARIKRFVN